MLDRLHEFEPCRPRARQPLIANRSFRAERLSLRDGARLGRLVRSFEPEVVIHFAGLKAVGASVLQPLDYYAVNVGGTLELLAALQRSSWPTARVLVERDGLRGAGLCPDRRGAPAARDESLTAGASGRSRRSSSDLAASDPSWSIALLRYFNPAGAHRSGLIGEDPPGASRTT